MLQTGEAQFAFPIPYEQATLLEKNKNIELMASPSIMQRYISMNVTQKPFDNPKVREALNYAINRPALVKVAFAAMQRQLLVWYRQVSPTRKVINRGLTIQ
ncbi:peptide transporter periplasmic-binding protein [Escherichia coli]|nr:peptide transporter periplasmic-binding protein [Escherichia coli]